MSTRLQKEDLSILRSIAVASKNHTTLKVNEINNNLTNASLDLNVKSLSINGQDIKTLIGSGNPAGGNSSIDLSDYNGQVYLSYDSSEQENLSHFIYMDDYEVGMHACNTNSDTLTSISVNGFSINSGAELMPGSWDSTTFDITPDGLSIFYSSTDASKYAGFFIGYDGAEFDTDNVTIRGKKIATEEFVNNAIEDLGNIPLEESAPENLKVGQYLFKLKK